jgi:hypothetical protein
MAGLATAQLLMWLPKQRFDIVDECTNTHRMQLNITFGRDHSFGAVVTSANEVLMMLVQPAVLA